LTVQDYRLKAQEAARRLGPGFLKIFIVYTIFCALLLFFSLQMQVRVGLWQETVREFVLAGRTELPPVTGDVLLSSLLALVLQLLVSVLRAGWYEITLRSVRGAACTWRDLPAAFPRIGKVFVISLIKEICCTAGLLLFVIPGVLLFYRWRMCWFVLADHPEYGPIQCLRASARITLGERMDLFRLDLTLLLPYGIAAVLFFFSNGVLMLWELPSIAVTHCVFYLGITHWEDRIRDMPRTENQ
jgi:hypothetical protein